MPSPLAHTAAGYLLRQGTARRPGMRLTAAFVFLSLLPDLDALPGFILRDLYTWHNNFSHSLAAGLAAAGLAGGAALLLQAPSARFWALATLLSWWAHLTMDFFTVGRGVMLFWPLSAERLASPVPLFYGLRWSADLWSLHHVITAVTEVLFILSLFLLLRHMNRERYGKMAAC